MSTSYYCIAKPVSALQVHDNTDKLDTIEFWIAGEYVGALTMDKHHVKSFVRRFIEYDDDFRCPLRSHWGGADRGSIVTVNRADIGDDEILAMEAGPELDELVARQVMGWTWDIHDFSTDIAEAWTVMEKVTAPPTTIEAARHAANTRFMHLWQKEHVWAMDAQEAATFICRAALLAVMEVEP